MGFRKGELGPLSLKPAGLLKSRRSWLSAPKRWSLACAVSMTGS